MTMRSYFVSACGTEEMLRLRPYVDPREPGTLAPWEAAERRAKVREEQAKYEEHLRGLMNHTLNQRQAWALGNGLWVNVLGSQGMQSARAPLGGLWPG
jgi:hypothetical protein